MVKHQSARQTKRSLRPKTGRRRARGVEPLEPRWVLAAPTLAVIQDVTLIAGAPLNIALDGFDADGDSLTFSATSNSGNVTTYIPVGNDSLRLHVVEKNAQGTILQDFGAMELQLFEDLVPAMTAHIKAYVQNGDYDGLTFHRIIENFMIQGGDPDGDGSGGLGEEIDDEYHLDLRFTSSGLLAMAKSYDDTNDSQFFITAGPTRHLDFNHTIFGFLTKGDDVRADIAGVSVNGETPVNRIEISSATIFQDIENGVLRLSAPIGTTGSYQITVRATDNPNGVFTPGNFVEQVFNVTVVPDTSNGNPFLEQIPEINLVVGETAIRNIQSVDAENDTVAFFGDLPGAGVTWNYGTGQQSQPIYYQEVGSTNHVANASLNVTATLPGKRSIEIFTLPSGLVPVDHRSAPRPPLSYTHSIIDYQSIRVNVTPEAPTAIDLLAESDLGGSSSDNFTSLDNSSAGKTLKFKVSGVWQGATVQLKIGDRVIGQATVPAATGGATPIKTEITITTNATEALAAGVHSIIAEQSVDGLISNYSQALNITVNAPTVLAAIGNQTVDEETELPFSVVATDPDAPSRETLVYSIAPGGPPSAFIDPLTGQFRWTPTESNGPGSFPTTIRVTDSFGTIVTRDFLITVNEVHENPVLLPPPPQTITAGEIATYQFVATDVDEPQNTLTFVLAPGSPAGASITTAGYFQFATDRELAPGPYTFNVTVDDGFGGTATETLTVNVQPGPLLNPIGNKQVVEGQSLLFTATAIPTIADDKLLFTLSVDDPAFQFLADHLDEDSGGFIWETDETHGSASFHVTVVVRDERGHEDMETFTITVLDTNLPPQLTPIADRTGNEREPILVSVTATDPDLPANLLVYSLDAAPAGAAINPLTGVFLWTPSEAQGGSSHTVKVRVSDGADGSATDEFKITVNKTNAQPTLAAIPAKSVVRGDTLGFLVSATDDDLPAQALTYALGQDAPDDASINPTTGAFSWSPSTSLPTGVYSFDVIASDNQGGSAAQTLTITVYDLPVEEPPTEEDPTDLPADLAEAANFPGSAFQASPTGFAGAVNNFSLANNLPAAVNWIGQGLSRSQPGSLPFTEMLSPGNEEFAGARTYTSPNQLGADTGVGTHWMPGLHTVNRPQTPADGENTETDVEVSDPSAAADDLPSDKRAATRNDDLRRSSAPQDGQRTDAAVSAVELAVRQLAVDALLSQGTGGESVSEESHAGSVRTSWRAPLGDSSIPAAKPNDPSNDTPSAADTDGLPVDAAHSAIRPGESLSTAAVTGLAAAVSTGVWKPLSATDVGKKTRDPGRIRRRRPR